MRIEFDFDIHDWMEFQKHYQRNSKQVKRSKIIATSILPAGFLILIFIDLINGKFSPTRLWFLGVVSLLWVLFYPGIMQRSMLKKTAKMLAEGDNSGLLGKHEITFEEDEIICKTPAFEQKMKWSGIKKFEETDHYYFLYDTAISAVIIPKEKLNIDKEKLDKLIKTYQ